MVEGMVTVAALSESANIFLYAGPGISAKMNHNRHPSAPFTKFKRFEIVDMLRIT
jgi:hypothetical protein